MLTWDSEEREEPGMMFSHGRSIIYIAKAFVRKIHKKGNYTSILDRFQNDEVFHASQLQHNWTKEWCDFLDYVRTIDITHSASPENFERYAALNRFRCDPKQMEKDPIKRRPDCHRTTCAVVSMNKEAGQTQESKGRHNYRKDLDPEKLDWLVWLLDNWKLYFAVNQISAVDSTQWHHHTSKEEHASGNREAFTHDQLRLCVCEIWSLKRNPQTSSFHSHLDVSHQDVVHQVALNYCVCDGCTHTPCCTHIFFALFSLRDVQTRTRMAQGVCSAHVISLHLTLSILMFHPPSLLFPHGHFDTSFPSAPSLPNCSRSESAGQAHFRTSGEEFGYLADPTHSTETPTLCIRWETEQASKRSLNELLTCPSEVWERLSKNCIKLRLRLRREIGKSNVRI